MNKKALVLAFFLLLVVFLFVTNYRYPYINPTVGKWSVGFQKGQKVFPGVDIKPEGIITYEYIDSLTPERTHYIADPFFVKEKGTFYLFVELKGEGNADIALLTSLDGTNYTYKGVVLDEDFHLSYPQVFKYKDNFFMVPETKGSNNVLLYKAQNYPYDWKVEDTLLKNYALKDPTLLLSPELNLMVAVDDHLKQYIFTADSLKGTWREVEDYKQRWGNETRPGGRFFEIDGDWYLPLQNRSSGYGTGISIFKLKADQRKIEFKPVEKMYLEPQSEIDWFNRGMHHLDIQQIEDAYYFVYDGDRKNGEKEFQYKRTIKFNLIDLYNFLTQ